jgi:hypothetical protein
MFYIGGKMDSQAMDSKQRRSYLGVMKEVVVSNLSQHMNNQC